MSKKLEREEAERQEQIQEEIRRVKLPKGKQVIGILDQRLGGSRMRVRCFDGKTRICRIPGRLRRKIWAKQGDTILIEPWEFGGDEKGDVIFKYRPTQINWLKRKGYIKEIEEFQEF
jgi:translation initiation factor 1A